VRASDDCAARGVRGRLSSVLEVAGAAVRLGLTSFGGPIAHLGYFREEYVVRRKWIDEARYADLVALCQFLPGPASRQVGMAIGIGRAGLLGGVAAWLGFTLPSAVVLVAFAYGVHAISVADAGWLHGLKVVAVAIVAQAVWGMARTLAADRERASLMILAAIAALASRTAAAQVVIIVLAGLLGWWLLPTPAVSSATAIRVPIGKGLAIGSLAVFFGLLIGLPAVREVAPTHALAVFDSFFRAGSLVFGGGHVVLPLLQAEVVPPGWVTNEEFVAGYGAAQALPGPLFTFAAYLGAVMHQPPNGWAGATLALVGVFLPRENPTWGRRRIRAELALLGYHVAELTVAKYMRRTSRRPSPTWRTFLAAHLRDMLLNLFHAILAWARHPAQGYLAHDPLLGQRRLPRPRIEREFLEPAEIEVLLKAAEPPDDTIIRLDVYTGLRRGELFALQWPDVDWEAGGEGGRLWVRRSLYQGAVTSPKTVHSERVVDVPQPILDDLAVYREMCPPKDPGYVFRTTTGKPLDPDNWYKRRFLPTLERAGLRRVGVHALRHTYASLLINQGESIKYVSRQLGHASIQITADLYGHLFRETFS
jgi:chromate transporter